MNTFWWVVHEIYPTWETFTQLCEKLCGKFHVRDVTYERTNRRTERRKLYNSRHKCRGYNNSKVFIFWGWHIKRYNTYLTYETFVPIWPRYEMTKLGTKWLLLGTKWPKSGYEMTKKWVRNDQSRYKMTRVRNDLGTKWLETVASKKVSDSSEILQFSNCTKL